MVLAVDDCSMNIEFVVRSKRTSLSLPQVLPTSDRTMALDEQSQTLNVRVKFVPGLGGNCDDYSSFPTSRDVSTTLKWRSPIASIAGSGIEEILGEEGRDRGFRASSCVGVDADAEDDGAHSTCKNNKSGLKVLARAAHQTG